VQQFKNFKIKFSILNIHFFFWRGGGGGGGYSFGPLEKEGYQLWLVEL